MRVKVRENWESLRQCVSKWPSNVRLSIQERRRQARDPDRKIFTFAWPSTNSSSKTSPSSTSGTVTASVTKRSTHSPAEEQPTWIRRCWIRLQRLAFYDEEEQVEQTHPPPRFRSGPHQPSSMATRTAKTAQPVVHKVIMVGSGGVGKSALTLQFMYDEVR